MSYRLRKFVFWLLLVALPLQSFAAATGWACTCMHLPKANMAAVAAAQDHQMTGHGAEEPAADQHGGEACHSTAAAEAPHCDSDSAHSADKTSCGACAGCCVVHAAIPAVVFAPNDVPAPRIDAIALPDLFTDHDAPTPKRPPRPLLA